MRWTKHKPEDGDTRIKTKFAFLPIKIGDEVRWLEKVTVKQEYREGYDLSYWADIEFISL